MSKVRKGLIQEAENEAAWNDWKQRTAGRRPKGRYYLIVCEGTKTEPNYFESIRQRLPGGQGDKIVVIGGQDNTLNLVERAREEITKRNQSDNAPYYHVWLVFDKDSFPDDDFDNAITLAEQENRKFGMKGDVLYPHWNAAWSNEAFELWYLFHFQENVGGGITRDHYAEMLSKYLGQTYKKNSAEMFDVLLPRLKVAIQRAQRAYNRWAADVPFHDRNPATAVYQLVGNLMAYASE
ncbi:MAG: RloB domain-containing protein [Kiritimatiellae bacterium]|nr:RloB domain-containing protein [Kiritimatiellia bacterium]